MKKNLEDEVLDQLFVRAMRKPDLLACLGAQDSRLALAEREISRLIDVGKILINIDWTLRPNPEWLAQAKAPACGRE